MRDAEREALRIPGPGSRVPDPGSRPPLRCVFSSRLLQQPSQFRFNDVRCARLGQYVKDAGLPEPIGLFEILRVTGDGQWVLFTELSSDRGYGPVRVMGVPISGGVPHEVFASATWAFPRCSAHGRCVVFEQRGDQMIISSLDPGSRQRR